MSPWQPWNVPLDCFILTPPRHPGVLFFNPNTLAHSYNNELARRFFVLTFKTYMYVLCLRQGHLLPQAGSGVEGATVHTGSLTKS